jgi:hypothetical protein
MPPSYPPAHEKARRQSNPGPQTGCYSYRQQAVNGFQLQRFRSRYNIRAMPKRSRKPAKPKGTQQLARGVLDSIALDAEPTKRKAAKKKAKDPAAVALGRKGGKKGGPARAAGMSAEERSESARNAAKARWRLP